MPPFTVLLQSLVLQMTMQLFFKTIMLITVFWLSCHLCGISWLQPHVGFTSLLTNPSPGPALTLSASAVQKKQQKNCSTQGPRMPLRDERVRLVPPRSCRAPSESYWRDTWHRLSSAPSPGRCCCCACASCRSSDTACALSPEWSSS